MPKPTEEQARVIEGIKEEFTRRLLEHLELLEVAFKIDCTELKIKRRKNGRITIEGDFSIDADLVEELMDRAEGSREINMGACH